MQVNIPDGIYTLEDGRKMTVSRQTMYVYPADTDVYDVPTQLQGEYAMRINYTASTQPEE